MNWHKENNTLQKEFKARSFLELMQKLNTLAPVADRQNHHPDFEVYGYNKIRFSLFTHDQQAITEKDYELAREIDLIFEV